jgi:hypothetical protein
MPVYLHVNTGLHVIESFPVAAQEDCFLAAWIKTTQSLPSGNVRCYTRVGKVWQDKPHPPHTQAPSHLKFKEPLIISLQQGQAISETDEYCSTHKKSVCTTQPFIWLTGTENFPSCHA